MRVLVGAHTTEQTLTGVAGNRALELAEANNIDGAVFTFKADGVVLPPDASIPSGAQVLELIETSDEPAPAEPEPEDDVDE